MPERCWQKLTLCAPPEAREALAVLLVEWGAGGTVEEADALVAYFPPEERGALEARLARYTTDLGAPIGWRWEDEPEDGWRDRWKAFYRPTVVSPRLGVCPSWEEWPAGGPAVEVIRMDPGQAFGTGAHETTRLCLRLLDGILAERPDTEVLDVGCGSGILSIGAVLLGARRAVALDIDPLATRAARQNARANAVAGRVLVIQGDIRAVRGTYPLVAANILYPVLVGLAPEIAGRVEPEGRLVLSGLLIRELDGALRAYAARGLREIARHTEGEWGALVLEKVKV